MPLPIPRKIHALAALHCQRRYAAHLIAIRDAAVIPVAVSAAVSVAAWALVSVLSLLAMVSSRLR
jgi:hypothetical protein